MLHLKTMLYQDRLGTITQRKLEGKRMAASAPWHLPWGAGEAARAPPHRDGPSEYEDYTDPQSPPPPKETPHF